MRNISFEQKPTVFGIKSPTIWISSRPNPSAIYPICYLRKPKCVTQEEFDKFVKALNFTVSHDFLEEISND